MRTQSDLVRPPTLNVAILKYLTISLDNTIPFSADVLTVGPYRIDGQNVMVYKEVGKLVFDLGDIQYGSVSPKLRSILGRLEGYLHRTEHLSYDDHIILKYTKYWD